jgi:hypothetical protein
MFVLRALFFWTLLASVWSEVAAAGWEEQKIGSQPYVTFLRFLRV